MIEELLKIIQEYNFKEASDLLIFLMGYFENMDYELKEVFKKIYDLL